MKKLSNLLLLIALFYPSGFLVAQELQTKENGLVYSAEIMNKLNIIVNDRSAIFQACEKRPSYASLEQAMGQILTDLGELDIVKAQIDSGYTFDQLLATHSNSSLTSDLHIVKRSRLDNGKITEAIYCYLPTGQSKLRIQEPIYFENPSQNGMWIFEKDGDMTNAIFLEQRLESKLIPAKYSEMIGYVDCMIDTTTQIFKPDTKGDYFGLSSSRTLEKFMSLMKYPIPFPNYKDYENKEEFNYEEYEDDINTYTQNKSAYEDSLIQTNKKISASLLRTLRTSIRKKKSSTEFESLVERHVSPEMALELKRNRIVVGGCSMDNGPRLHAYEIARLSAETTNWSIFLRSHLDLMNDNFSRLSDGSYAQASRMTYIKELESLDLDIPSLLLGISLSYKDAAKNHYFGNNSRVGRAINESEGRKEIIAQLLRAIKDNELDVYNRMLMSYLLLNSFEHLESISSQEIAEAKGALQTLPNHVSKRLIELLSD